MPTIQPITRHHSLGATIAQQLQQLIQQGVYPAGSLLPSQRELARQFGASVPSVREAISVLSAVGLLEARTGQGTVVRSLSSASSDFTGWLGLADDQREMRDLLQTRQLLEQFTIRQATAQLDDLGRERLCAALKQLEDSQNSERYVSADMALHLLIADLAGNVVVSRLMRIIQQPLQQQVRRSVSHLYNTGQLEISLQDHRLLVSAICGGQSEQAFTALYSMLERAERLGAQSPRPS